MNFPTFLRSAHLAPVLAHPASAGPLDAYNGVHGTLSLEKWFALIDGMPMRRQEIQNKQNKGR